MNNIDRRLCLAGVTLFLFGLALGFIVPVFGDKQGVLNAHLTALGSGIFLIVAGMLWSHLAVSGKFSSVLAHGLWISFFVLEAGLTLDATKTPGAADSPTIVHSVAGLLNAVGAIFMFVAVSCILVLLIKAKPTTFTR